MTKRKRTPKLYASGSTQLDPLHCASAVAFRIYRSQYNNKLYGEVLLNSCDKLIEWQLHDDDGSSAHLKLQRAIDILTRAQIEWLHAKRARRSGK